MPHWASDIMGAIHENWIGEHMISGTQVRAARAILDWSVPSENSRQLAAVRATLEAAGIEFLEGNVTARRTPPFPH